MYDNGKRYIQKHSGSCQIIKVSRSSTYEHVGKLPLKWDRQTNTEKVAKFTWVPLGFRGNINHITRFLCQAILNSVSCTFLNDIKEKKMALQQVQTEVEILLKNRPQNLAGTMELTLPITSEWCFLGPLVSPTTVIIAQIPRILQQNHAHP